MNRDKFKLDRYERRLRIYQEVVWFIVIGCQKANYDNDELMTFRPKVSEADFLFGEEVRKYIDELHSRAVNLHRWKSEYRDSTQTKPEGYDHQNVVDEMHKELRWVTAQLEPARKIFKKYLDVSR